MQYTIGDRIVVTYNVPKDMRKYRMRRGTIIEIVDRMYRVKLDFDLRTSKHPIFKYHEIELIGDM